MEKNFEFEAYKREHVAFRMNEAMSGYYRLEMYEPNTKSEIRNSILLIDEPADEENYDYEIAREFFEQYIKENFNNRALNIINRAVKEGVYLPSLNNRMPEDIVCECETLILDNEDNVIDEYAQCDLEFTNRGQYYNYYDGDYSKNCSGEIWNSDKYEFFYTEKGNGELDFDHPLRGYELESGKSYAFIYDKVINNEAKVVGLYDFYEA